MTEQEEYFKRKRDEMRYELYEDFRNLTEEQRSLFAFQMTVVEGKSDCGFEEIDRHSRS
jgi:hypothetical protein